MGKFLGLVLFIGCMVLVIMVLVIMFILDTREAINIQLNKEQLKDYRIDQCARLGGKYYIKEEQCLKVEKVIELDK